MQDSPRPQFPIVPSGGFSVKLGYGGQRNRKMEARNWERVTENSADVTNPVRLEIPQYGPQEISIGLVG